MPTYVYKDTVTGLMFEAIHSIFADDLTESPAGNPVVKVLQPAPTHFKGPGFYSTTK